MKVFTTGQVAKICKVAPRTVSKWFDSGRLKGYRIPGSQDRRIPREYLIKFLKEHGMPLGDLEDEAMQICQNLRKNPDFSETILIALLPDDGQPVSFDRSAINETFKKPFDASLLAERLRTLIGSRKELV